MRAERMPGEHQIADVLVLVLSAGVSLRAWEAAGILEREAALYQRLAGRYGRLLVVSEGRRDDEPLAARLGSPGAAPPELVCNERGEERGAYIAGLPVRVRERLGGAQRIVVKTNQFDAGDAAVQVCRGLREAGVRVGLVARGGYPWSRFVAWEAGAESARASEAGAAEGELCRTADVVVGTTERMLDELRWRHGLAADRTVLVPNYITDDARPDPSVPREPGTVLCAGRLVAQKRVDLLIDALGELRGRGGGPVRLTVVGGGELENDLRSHARERGVGAEFLARMPQGELLALMRRCAVFAQASAYEGHPKTVIEAMACGAPVVVTDSPGLGDVVEAGVTGLVARGTPESLAAALARVLRDPDLAGALGREAAATMEALRLERLVELEARAHEVAIERAGERSDQAPGVVRWGPELLGVDPEAAAAAWARSMQGYSRRLAPERRARFAAAVETPLYHVIDRAAMETAGGVHPKHGLMKYHDFFVERVRPGERVLDLGCGYGEVARSIAARTGAHVTGMDWSEANVAQAQAMIAREGLGDRVRIVRGDITRERVGEAGGPARFDVIVLSNVLEHLRDREALLSRYVEWYAPRAVLIRVPAFDRNWQTAWKRELGVDFRCDDTHETEYTEAGLRAELAAAGLAVREVVARWGEYWVSAEPAPREETQALRPDFADVKPVVVGAGYSTDGEYTDRESKAAYIGRKYAPALGGSVLDVGCGERLLRRHVGRPDQYVGVDFGGAADVTVDLEGAELPFEDRSFDTVVCTDVLEHLEAAHAVLDECCRVSRSRVIVSLPNPARNFIAEVFAGSAGRMKYYGLPAENPGDRHRWFFGFEEAEAFVRARASRNGFDVEHLDSSHDGCCYWKNGRGEDVLDHPNIRRGTLWAVLRRPEGGSPGA